MQGYLLFYVFACFSVGIACLSATILSARRKGDTLARAFLVFYVSLSVLVIGALLRAFIDVLPDPVSPAVRFSIEYVDSIVGYYALMFSLPFFAHRVFAVEDRRRDYRIGALVAVALAMQHLTEFWLPKVWDQRGDIFEDIVFASIVVYVLWLAFTRLGDSRVYRPLALRFLALVLIAVPGSLYDFLLGDRSAFRFFPLWYCAVSILITWCLVRRPFAARPGEIPAEWGLSDREAEVARLVQKGLSNKDIAEQLHISPNTVKTHLRLIFDKSGVRSRFELIAAVHWDPSPEPGLEATKRG